LIYAAVADEEAQGRFGAAHLLDHETDAVQADYVITESGGTPIDYGSGLRLPVLVGEKGTYWCRLVVRGTGGHASTPWGTDNAVLNAAEVVRRLGRYQPPALISDTWRTFVERAGLPPALAERLADPDRVDGALDELPFGLAQEAHASTHTTFAPTIIHGGVKTNVIPDRAEVEVDIRMLPGQTYADIDALVATALGDLAGDVDVVATDHGEPTSSPTDTPLWDALSKASERFYAGTPLVPQLSVGATDGRFFRMAGSVAYGYALFSQRTSYDDYVRMFHGDDERVDVESLRLSTELWEAVARDMLA
jgi:acetylornithine deacetylase/succinyl-diaminopimelate desuccinylase-like protein